MTRYLVRIGPVSARLDVRSIVVSTVLVGVIFVLFCWTISVGDFPIPIREVIATLFGGGSEDSRFVVGELRLPRALVGALVGAAFGLSGAIFQTLARNPLASPDIIGVTQGASLAAVAVIVLGGSAICSAGSPRSVCRSPPCSEGWRRRCSCTCCPTGVAWSATGWC